MRDTLQGAAFVTVSGKVGSNERLFGAISTADIADAAKKELGVTLDRRKIVVRTAIKSLGEHTVMVNLHPEVTATLKVRVTAL